MDQILTWNLQIVQMVSLVRLEPVNDTLKKTIK